MSKVRLLLLGPLPPPLGGNTVLFEQLCKDLEKEVLLSVTVININLSGGIISKLFLYVALLSKIIRNAFIHNVICLQAGINGTMTLGPFLFILSRLLDRPFVLRRFGGNTHKIYQQQNKFSKWILDNFILKADLLFFETKEQVSFFNNLTNSKCLWFPNNRPLPKGKKQNFNDRANRFVYIGFVRPEKGLDELIKVFSEPDFPVVLDIYGQDLMNISQKIHGISNINYLGLIDSSEVYEILEKYDALVLPTYWKGEGYPGVIIEAYMKGLPVISTTLPSIMEIVEDRRTGLLIEPKDPIALKNAIFECYNNPTLFKQLIKGVSEEREKFSSQRWTTNFTEEILLLWRRQ